MTSGDHRAPFYLGIDLGGTNIHTGVVDDLGPAFLINDGQIVDCAQSHAAECGHDRGADGFWPTLFV